MSETFLTYVPSEKLRTVVLPPFKKRVLSYNPTEKDIAYVDFQIDESVRGFISTLGLSLDAAQGETCVMTEAGVMKEEMAVCYRFRLPVCEGDESALIQAITEDLYKYAGHPAMEMASAKLDVRNGELVVIGLHARRKPGTTRHGRAALLRL